MQIKLVGDTATPLVGVVLLDNTQCSNNMQFPCIQSDLENNVLYIYIYISLVYSLYSDRVGLPVHNISSPGVLMKSIGAELL